MRERSILRWERRSDRLLSPTAFAFRWLRWFAAAMLITGASLFVGAFGYRVTEGMGWLDAVLNAAMILTGMGPVATLKTDSGKLFAICYAIFSSGVFLVVAGMLVGPLAHRVLHRFHLDSKAES